jgi:hypothetical protein
MRVPAALALLLLLVVLVTCAIACALRDRFSAREPGSERLGWWTWATRGGPLLPHSPGGMVHATPGLSFGLGPAASPPLPSASPPPDGRPLACPSSPPGLHAPPVPERSLPPAAPAPTPTERECKYDAEASYFCVQQGHAGLLRHLQ